MARDVRLLALGTNAETSANIATALVRRRHVVLTLPSTRDLVLHGAPFALAIVDAEGVDMPLARLGRLLRSAAQGQPVSMLVLTHDTSPSHTAQMAEALVSDFQRKPREGEVDGEEVADRVDFLLRAAPSRAPAQQATRTESLFRQVAESAPLAFFALDEKGTLQLAEGGALRKLGFSQQRPIGRSIFELYDDVGPFVEDSRRALAGEGVRRRVEVDGRVLQTQFSPSRAADGRITGAFAISTDITEQAQAEHDLKRSEAGFRSLIEQSADGVLVHQRGRGLYANAALAGFFVRPLPGAFFGCKVDDLLPEEARARFDELTREIHEIGVRRQLGEVNVKDDLGETRPAEISLAGVIFDGQLAIATTFHDLSERKRIEAQQLALERSERARLENELGIAQRLQASLLPTRPVARRLSIAAKMIPATEIGGDYYDVIPREERSWIGMGDVAGHGLDAGLIMLMVQTTISAFARRPDQASPSEILRAVNDALFENLRNRLNQRTFVTLTLLHHDGHGKFVFAGAHEEMVVWRAATGRCELIETPGSWLGASRSVAEYMPENEMQLFPGDLLFLYTDGLTEARAADKEQFGLPRLCEALEARSHLPPETICAELLGLVARWQVHQEDDQTAMIIRYG